MSTPASQPLSHWWARAAGDPDISRAIRATVGFMVPLVLALAGKLPLNVSFLAITAQNIAMVDIRGDYRMRCALLLAMAAVFTGVTALGTAAAHNLAAALVATVVVTACGSVWRHLSSDYGPGLAITSTFVFVYALATPPGPSAVANHTVATLAGALWGIAIQVAAWPFRPQHPLRRAVSDAWIAVAELFDVLGSSATATGSKLHQRVVEKEAAVRTMLDVAYAAIAGARPTDFTRRLEAVNLMGARLAMRVTALATTLESVRESPEFIGLQPTLDPLLTSLSNLSRSVAVTVVSRQPAHLAICEVRLRRIAALIAVVRARLAALGEHHAAFIHVAETLAQVEAHLPHLHDALRATIARADERAAFSLELLDLRAQALRPLASALNLSPRVDPALVRFTFRAAILTVAGVLAFKLLHLPHGYWVPFTIMVVLQPDYGSTRQRAAQRMLGTVAGSVLATILLWLHLPFPAVMLLCTGTILIFGYWVKRNYGIAVIFITLFVVLLTEATGPVTVALAIERLASTVAGGLLALLAAQLFWPVWERDRLPPIIAETLRANRDYLGVLVARVSDGRGFDGDALAAKRRAERANSAAFSSLNRMHGDPKNQREGLEQAATLANGSQRITRALNALAVPLAPGASWPEARLKPFAATMHAAFDAAVAAVETGQVPPQAGPLVRELEADALPVPPAQPALARWAFTQLTQTATELAAVLVALQNSGEPAAPNATPMIRSTAG